MQCFGEIFFGDWIRTETNNYITSVDYRIPGLDGDEHDDKRHIAEMLKEYLEIMSHGCPLRSVLISSTVVRTAHKKCRTDVITPAGNGIASTQPSSTLSCCTLLLSPLSSLPLSPFPSFSLPVVYTDGTFVHLPMPQPPLAKFPI